MYKNISLIGGLLLAFLVFCSLMPTNISQSNTLEERTRCNYIVDVKTDTITGIVKLMAKEKIKLLDKDGKMLFNMMMIRHDKSITLHFKALKPVCISQNTQVIFEFTDDSKSKVKSSNMENCKGILAVNMGGIFGDSGVVKKLSSSTIRNIKIVTKKESYQIDLDIDQKERILNTLDCFIYS